MKNPVEMSIEELTSHINYCKDLKAQRLTETNDDVDDTEEEEVLQ
jgi:hypothetical protein